MGETGRALTFVTPEDEEAWIKLSRQGAPEIRELDTRQLVEEGSWHYRPATRQPTVSSNGNRRRRWTSRPRRIA
jgi:hypothetical protein